MNYTGTIVAESLKDQSILNEFSVLNTRTTDDENPADQWHLYKVEATKEQLEKLSLFLKSEKWYAHFWNKDEMIVVFPKKIFEQKVSDKATWIPAIEYGLSLGIPEKQLDFLIE